jgi:hypothetical protein
VLTLLAKLEKEFGEEPKQVAAPKQQSSGGPVTAPGEGLYSRANSVDTIALLDLLGIGHHPHGSDEHAICPGCGEDGALVCENGGLKCLHDRCSLAGPPKNKGFRAPLDIVAQVKQCSPKEAALWICERFGLERPAPPRQQPAPKPQQQPKRQTAPARDPQEREPGDDSEEIAKSPKKSAVELYGVATMRSMYLEVLKRSEKGPERGFTTGVRELDIILGGLRRGNVTLLAAQTSWGKSSFGVMTTLSNAGTEGRPLVVSTEDQQLMYARRMVSRECRINSIRLRDNKLDMDDLRKLTTAAKEAPDDPIFLDAIGVGKDVEWVAKAISALVHEFGISVVIADYLQRFKTRKQFGPDKKNQTTYIAETLSDAVKNGKAAGLFLSQLKRTDKEPTTNDVKESGDLENMAEHIVIGWRKIDPPAAREEGVPVEHRLFNVPKNKDGPIEMEWLELEFEHVTASFTGNVIRGQQRKPIYHQPGSGNANGFGNGYDE